MRGRAKDDEETYLVDLFERGELGVGGRHDDLYNKDGWRLARREQSKRKISMERRRERQLCRSEK